MLHTATSVVLHVFVVCYMHLETSRRPEVVVANISETADSQQTSAIISVKPKLPLSILLRFLNPMFDF